MPVDERKLKNVSQSSKKDPKFTVSKVKPVSNNKDADHDEILKISKENNVLLKKLVRHQKWETFFGLLKILIIIIPLVAAYIFLTPLVEQVVQNYREAIGTVNELQTTTGNLNQLEGVDIKEQLKEMGELFK